MERVERSALIADPFADSPCGTRGTIKHITKTLWEPLRICTLGEDAIRAAQVGFRDGLDLLIVNDRLRDVLYLDVIRRIKGLCGDCIAIFVIHSREANECEFQEERDLGVKQAFRTPYRSELLETAICEALKL